MQPLEAAQLVDLEVALRVVQHHSALPAVGVDAQHDLLRHRAAGHVHRGGLAEERSDLSLELGHDPAVAVDVGDDVGRDGRELIGRAGESVAGQEAAAGSAELRKLGQRRFARAGIAGFPGSAG